jgi:hypothetical protein
MKHRRDEPLAPTQTAVRHIAREAGRLGPVPRVMTWELVTVTFVALLIIAAIAVLVVGIPQ